MMLDLPALLGPKISVSGRIGISCVSANLALADVVVWNRDLGERLARLAHLDEALEIAAREERDHDAGVVVLVIPEIDQLAVGKEDERRAQLLGVGERLLLGDVRVNRLLLGFDHRQGPAVSGIEHVVGATGAVGSRFGRNAGVARRLVGDVDRATGRSHQDLRSDLKLFRRVHSGHPRPGDVAITPADRAP
jgi:hypothetical protein